MIREIREILEWVSCLLPGAVAVGGAIRDLLLGRAPKDIDIASPFSAGEVLERARQAGVRAWPKSLEHGVVVIDTPFGEVEITTFRRDVATDGRRAKVEATRDLLEDLARRDFTINAMAIDGEGRLIDPFGGAEDLKRGVVRAVGDPNHRFREDYLRVIRAARFAARYGFEIEPSTRAALVAAAPKVLDYVSVDRVREEFSSAFKAEEPSRFLREMYELGILPRLLPEFEGTDQLTQNPAHHPEGDVLTHVLQVVDRAPQEVRWHALFHDYGKRATAEAVPGTNYYRFPRHDQFGAELAAEAARALRFPNRMVGEFAAVARWHMYPLYLGDNATEAQVRRFQARAGREVDLEALKAVCVADAGDRRPGSIDRLFAPLPVPVKPVLQGRHLIEAGMKPGPAFRRALSAAYEYQLATGTVDIGALLRVALEALE